MSKFRKEVFEDITSDTIDGLEDLAVDFTIYEGHHVLIQKIYLYSDYFSDWIDVSAQILLNEKKVSQVLNVLTEWSLAREEEAV